MVVRRHRKIAIFLLFQNKARNADPFVTRRDGSDRKVHLLEPRKSRKYSRGVKRLIF